MSPWCLSDEGSERQGGIMAELNMAWVVLAEADGSHTPSGICLEMPHGMKYMAWVE